MLYVLSPSRDCGILILVGLFELLGLIYVCFIVPYLNKDFVCPITFKILVGGICISICIVVFFLTHKISFTLTGSFVTRTCFVC